MSVVRGPDGRAQPARPKPPPMSRAEVKEMKQRCFEALARMDLAARRRQFPRGDY